MAKNYYVDGAWNLIDDRSGLKIKSTDAVMEWNGRIVHRDRYEPRHPQDLARSFPDDQSVPNPRPRATDKFLSDTEVTVDDL